MITSINGGLYTRLHKLLWSSLTSLGTRHLIAVIRTLFPTYRDTLFYFDPPHQDNKKKLVALTIDDGISRGGIDSCMLPQVLEMLERYNAHATLFVCSDYCIVDENLKQATRELVLRYNHELGHHMARDVSGYYSKLSQQEFSDEFEASLHVLEDLVNTDGGSNGDSDTPNPFRIRWFRAPQGVYTKGMQQALNDLNTNHDNNPIIRHVLGDCYCDDWAFACRDPNFVVETTLKQVKPGSILITHMPEKNTDRQAILGVLERILLGLDSRGYKCVSLSEMWQACGERHAHST